MTKELEHTNRTLAHIFKLPPQMCHLLRLLISMPYITTDVVKKELKVKYDPRTLFFRLRKHMSAYGIIIYSQYGGIYWLERDMKIKIKEIVHERL